MKAVTRERLEFLIATVGRELARIDEVCGKRPSFADEDYSFAAMDAWWQKRGQEIKEGMRRLAVEGATFSEQPGVVTAIRLAGTRSSSTSGFEGALRNWITAAHKRLEKEAAR